MIDHRIVEPNIWSGHYNCEGAVFEEVALGFGVHLAACIQKVETGEYPALRFAPFLSPEFTAPSIDIVWDSTFCVLINVIVDSQTYVEAEAAREPQFALVAFGTGAGCQYLDLTEPVRYDGARKIKKVGRTQCI
jgi:hypothetical protein